MIKVDVSEIMGLERAFEGLAGGILDENLRQGATIAGAQVQSEARALVPVDTGALRLSIENTLVTTGDGYLIEVGPTQPYGKEIEYGRPVGTYVSPAALAGWATRKGLNPYAVAWSISQKGSPAQPYLGPAMDAKEETVLSILSQAVANAIAQAFGRI